MKLSRTACPLLLLGLLLGLLRLGDEQLTVPLHSVSALSDWMSKAPPIDMAAALLRQAGIVLAAYLFVTTTVAVIAQALGCRRVAVLVLRAGVPTARPGGPYAVMRGAGVAFDGSACTAAMIASC